jgi:oligopeptide/dipeptide ABC transporter ATP-binding protein
MTSKDPLLQVEDLHTSFYTDAGTIQAVRGVSFSLDHTEVLGIVGESGCGKTVTGLSILQLIPEPPGKIERGRIIFQGQDLLSYTDAQMRRIRGNHIAMIFQEPMTSLNPIFTVGYQIMEVIRLHQQTSKRRARKSAVEMLRSVGLPDPEKRVNEYPHQMSGGMRQRVMIAMALCCRPKLIVADEPTTALDVTIQAQIIELISQLKADTGASILMITHDLGVIAEVADSVAVMYAGKIVEQSLCDDLFDRPSHPYTLGLMNSIPRIDVPAARNKPLKTITGVVPSLLALPDGCSFQERCPRVMTKCRKLDPPNFALSPNHRVRCWLHET